MRLRFTVLSLSFAECQCLRVSEAFALSTSLFFSSFSHMIFCSPELNMVCSQSESDQEVRTRIGLFSHFSRTPLAPLALECERCEMSQSDSD